MGEIWKQTWRNNRNNNTCIFYKKNWFLLKTIITLTDSIWTTTWHKYTNYGSVHNQPRQNNTMLMLTAITAITANNAQTQQPRLCDWTRWMETVSIITPIKILFPIGEFPISVLSQWSISADHYKRLALHALSVSNVWLKLLFATDVSLSVELICLFNIKTIFSHFSWMSWFWSQLSKSCCLFHEAQRQGAGIQTHTQTTFRWDFVEHSIHSTVWGLWHTVLIDEVYTNEKMRSHKVKCYYNLFRIFLLELLQTDILVSGHQLCLEFPGHSNTCKNKNWLTVSQLPNKSFLLN